MNKTDEALANILTTLAAKFGTTVDHLYAIMIKQAFIDGIESLIGIIAFGMVFTILAIKLNRFVKAEDAKKEERYGYTWEWDDNPWLAFLTMLFGLIFLSFLIFGGINAIDCFFNPEYYALHQIIKQ